METKNTEHMDEADCIQFVGSLIASHAFRFSSEYELQNGLEELFTKQSIQFKREVKLSSADIVDFVVYHKDGSIALEVKTQGTRNALLRQIGRYLQHDSITSAFVVGTPFWVRNLPEQLTGKSVYRHRILSGIL